MMVFIPVKFKNAVFNHGSVKKITFLFIYLYPNGVDMFSFKYFLLYENKIFDSILSEIFSEGAPFMVIITMIIKSMIR